MKIFLIRFLPLISCVFSIILTYAQSETDKTKNDISLEVLTGYGTENNWGNTGFFAGIALTKPVKRHLFLGTSLTRFTTDIYNVYKDRPSGFDNEDRKYNAWFLNAVAKYTFGDDKSLFNTKIAIAPSLKYYNYKILGQFQAIVYPDGRREAVPGTVTYSYKKGLNLMLYNAVSFDAKISRSVRIGVFLDVYSGLIPIEHFMPGINASFKLR